MKSAQIVLLAVVLGGCDSGSAGKDEAPTGRTVVGQLLGTDIFFGAARTDQGVSAYVCGSDETVSSHSGWIEGPIDEEDGSFAIEDDGFELEGVWDEDGFEAELTDRLEEQFEVDAKEPQDEAGGVFVAEDEETETETGVVVIEVLDNADFLAKGASCDRNRSCFQVIILAPASDSDFNTLNVKVNELSEEFTVERL